VLWERFIRCCGMVGSWAPSAQVEILPSVQAGIRVDEWPLIRLERKFKGTGTVSATGYYSITVPKGEAWRVRGMQAKLGTGDYTFNRAWCTPMAIGAKVPLGDEQTTTTDLTLNYPLDVMLEPQGNIGVEVDVYTSPGGLDIDLIYQLYPTQ